MKCDSRSLMASCRGGSGLLIKVLCWRELQVVAQAGRHERIGRKAVGGV